MNERADTKTRILDAAEKLFGDKGFDATSLRDITAEADVNLAAVNYHFQSKEALISAVVMRWAGPMNIDRVARLESYGENPTLEQILEAFVAPVLEVRVDINVMPFMGRVLGSPDVMVRLFKDHMVVVADRFTSALAKVLPELNETDLLWRLHFTAGAMAHTITRAPLLNELWQGKLDISDRQKVVDRLVAYAAAGFRAKGVE